MCTICTAALSDTDSLEHPNNSSRNAGKMLCGVALPISIYLWLSGAKSRKESKAFLLVCALPSRIWMSFKKCVDTVPLAMMQANKISSLVTETSVDSLYINSMIGLSCICLSKPSSITLDTMISHFSIILCT